jgi:hypothetical protein
MYETAIRLSLSGGHLGDYSKEALEKPSEHYEGKMPKKQPDQISHYKFQINFN